MLENGETISIETENFGLDLGVKDYISGLLKYGKSNQIDLKEAAANSFARVETSVNQIVRYRQYPTYQASLDIFSQNLKPEEVYRKTFLYIMDWVKLRVGENILKEDRMEVLRNFPKPENFENFELSDDCGFKLKGDLDIRLFVNASDSLALKIEEPDNRSESHSSYGEKPGQIYGRTFTTDIALSRSEEGAVLAMQVSCREPETNMERAKEYRLGFIRNMFLNDQDLEMKEHGLSSASRFVKMQDEDGKFICNPIMLEEKDIEDFQKDFLLENKFQMPLIICSPDLFMMEEGQERPLTLKSISSSLLAFAHVVVIANDLIAKVFPENGPCSEYGDELSSGDTSIIVHTGLAENGLPRNPMTMIVTTADDPALEDINPFVQDIPEMSCTPFRDLLDYAQSYTTGMDYHFADTQFYREMKKAFYEKQGIEGVAKINRANEEKISTLTEQLLDKSQKLEKLSQNNKNLSITISEKQQTIQENNRQSDELETKLNKKIKELDEQVRKLSQENILLRPIEIPKMEKEAKDKIKSKEHPSLFKMPEKFQDPAIYMLVKEEAMKVLLSSYKTLNPEYRRFEIVNLVLQMDADTELKNWDYASLFTYPPQLEFFPGEVKDIISDIFDDAKNDVLNEILEANDFAFEVKEKKEELYQIRDYRNISSIESVLRKTGFVLKNSSNHCIYRYYDDERYKITVACTPTDVNSGRNLYDTIVEQCL